jgi:hypothetical protein
MINLLTDVGISNAVSKGAKLRLIEAQKEGVLARHKKKASTANPYDIDGALADAWAYGWLHSKELLDEVFQSKDIL